MSTEWDSVRRECSQLEAQLEVRAKCASPSRASALACSRAPRGRGKSQHGAGHGASRAPLARAARGCIGFHRARKQEKLGEYSRLAQRLGSDFLSQGRDPEDPLLGDESGVALARALASGAAPRLESLDIEGNDMTDVGIIALAAGLAENGCPC